MSVGAETTRPELTSDVHESTAPIAAEWDALAERLGATPFAYPGWFEAWLAAFPVSRVAIVSVHRGSELVGVLPLEERRGTRASLTNWHSPRFEVLASDADAARALVQAALRGRRLSLSFVEMDSGAIPALVENAETAGYSVRTRDAEASPEVAVTGPWDEYLRSISKNMRREFKRRQKRLAEAGEFVFEVHDGCDDVEARVREAFAVEASSWKGESGTAVAVEPATLDFYLRVARWAATRGWLRVCLMRLDGVPIASDFALEADGIFYSLKGGYDPAYSEYSPGRLMDGLEIQRAFDLGLRRFEFGGDPEHHKMQWRPELRQLAHVDAFARTPAGAVERFVAVEGRSVARAARDGARKILRR